MAGMRDFCQKCQRMRFRDEHNHPLEKEKKVAKCLDTWQGIQMTACEHGYTYRCVKAIKP